MGRLNGKVAIVTGAGRGIGRATAKLFASEGAKVSVVSLTPANVDTVVADIEAAGGTAIGVAADISNADQIKAATEKTVAAFGGIDILVNNAFDPSAPFSSIIDLSVEQLQRNFEMGPIAYLRTMQARYPYLKASGEGRIINFGSMAGVIGLVGYGPYNMAKEAVRALTRTAAREWGADKITVNNVLPVAETWDKEMNRARADQPARSLWITGRGHRTSGPVSREQGRSISYGLQPHSGWRLDHRQRALTAERGNMTRRAPRDRQRLCNLQKRTTDHSGKFATSASSPKNANRTTLYPPKMMNGTLKPQAEKS